MMKKILYLLCILIVSPAFAGGKDVSAFIEQWGNNVFNTCPSHNFPSDAYVADMGEYNAYGGDWNGDFCKVGKGYKIMAALSVTDTGAYFCPVFVYALAPGWNKDTHTRYGRYGGANDCAWLCLPGWTGERCETKSENGTTCDLSELRRENYAKYSGQGTAEAETEIAMFKMDVNQKCYGKNTNAEHDMILAITGFLDNGHGAYVSQVNVVGYRYWGWASNGLSCYCAHIDKNKNNCEKHTIRLDYNPDGKILVCKNGYKPNKDGTDCEAISQEACNAPLCAKVANGFNSQFHTIVEYESAKYDSDGALESSASCTFKCKDPEKGLKSTEDATCVECKRGLRQGVSTKSYTCLQCADGMVYDSSTGSCQPAIGLSKTDLMYGYERTASAADEDQCWQKVDMEAYRKCINDSLSN